MRKQPRSAARLTAVLLTITSAAAVLGVIAPAAHADNEDRTDSADYTAARADYWQARADYEARKAATQARKDGLTDGSDDAADGGGGDSGGGGGGGGGSGGSGQQAVVADAPSSSAGRAGAVYDAPEPDWGPTAAQWAALRRCESGDDYSINTGNGYYGAYQFSPITWWWLGYQGYPNQAAPWVQDQAARDLWAIYGWSPWPACSRALDFR
jgi:hypothetical protein